MTEKDDVRLPFNSIASSLTKNLGRLPVISEKSWTCGQSSSINVYIAATRNLMGEKGNWKDFCDVLTIQESVKEMNQAYRELIPYGTTPTKELNEKWFESGAKDRAPKSSDFSNRDRYFHWYCGRLEDLVSLSKGSYAVGNRISLADVLIYNLFRERLRDEESPKTLPSYRREPFGDYETTTRILRASYPKLCKICDLVGDHPGVKKWLSMRGVQRF